MLASFVSILQPTDWTLSEVLQHIHQPSSIQLSADAEQKILTGRQYLDDTLQQSDKLFYGINTGFGYLQHVKIDKDQTTALQYNLIQSHACGMGDRVPTEVVKLMLLLKIKSLSYGHSGVQLQTVQRLIDLYNHNYIPVVYKQGSLGASGDLAPLSHLCLPLIGLGQVEHDGEVLDTSVIYARHQWQPIALKSKEGLALINGTQFMSAYAWINIAQAIALNQWADVITCMSLDAFDGSVEPFHPAIHAIRSHNGQVQTAKNILQTLADSKLAHSSKKQVQDPYSFRCVPQVHGATKDCLHFIISTCLKEINSVTDNPNIFPEENLILSGGNFHGQPLAYALDLLSITTAELGSISERRIFQLLSGQRGLPLFLIQNPGLHSGFMIPQYTAAGIVSENKMLCMPNSVDSITSSNGQEDHVSMGANAAVKCYHIVQNVHTVLAIELLTAAQALNFKQPEQSSSLIQTIHNQFRQYISFNSADRFLHTDMQRAKQFLQQHKQLVDHIVV